MKKIILLLAIGSSFATLSQTARVQAIHNSADAATDTVDVWLTTGFGSTKLVDDFAFRSATPFIDAPAGSPISLSFAPKSSTVIGDTIPGLTFNYTLTPTETYVIVADGIVSPTGYSPAQPFNLEVYTTGRETAASTGNTDVLVHHGSTDAPIVDVDERTAGNLVNDAAYTNFAGYLELTTADYILDIKDQTGLNTVASFEAPLATLGLTNSALVVVASGFLNPSNNANGPAFGLWVALPTGGDLIPLPSAAPPTARIQVIHNSADAAADSVDVYLDGTLLIDNFAFRTASPFIDAPAENNIQIAIAPKTSNSVADSIAVFNYNLDANGTYVIVADGIVSGSGYSPAQPFSLEVYANGRETASTSGNTDVLVHHGSTDAPIVDINERIAGNLVDDAAYTNFAGYLQLTTADYTLDIKDQTGITDLASFGAPLATLGLTNSALVVVASGFLNPANNSGGPAFGLWVALPSGGDLIPLPAVSGPTTSLNENEIKNLNVYPNPARNLLNIEGLDFTNVNIKIISIDGKVIKNTQFNVSNKQINIQNLVNGSYTLIISDENTILSKASFIKF